MRPQNSSQILRAAKTRNFVVTNLTNIRYLTGMEVSYGFVFIKPKGIHLYVDSRYVEAAQKEVRKGVEVHPLSVDTRPFDGISQCGFEADDVTVDRLSKWKRKNKNTKFIQKRGVIEEFRRSKEKDELKKFIKAQRITHELMARVPSALNRSITEKGLAELLRQWAVELGADGLSFDPIVAFGTHTSRPHHKPTTRKLKKGHIVQIDVGARYQGYCADQSEVFFTAQKTEEQQRVYSAVARAKEESMKLVKVGVTNHVLDTMARKILAEENLEEYFTHSLGHGVGLDIHEGPSLSKKASKTKLLKNEIVTIEPGVYIPGKFGMRLEEEIVV